MALAVGAVLAVGNATGRPGVVDRPVPEVAASATEPAPPSPSPPAPPPPLPKERVDALVSEMRGVVLRVSPNAKITGFQKSGPFGQYENSHAPPSNAPDWRKAMGHRPDGIVDGERYDATMIVKLGDREGELAIHLVRFGDPVFRCIGLVGECSETPGPSGSTVLVNKHVIAAMGEISYTVNVTYPGGIRVWVIHTNAIDAGSTHHDRPPLTIDQVKQIALDPALIPVP
ncbi:MAG TPA: hypothetical protein VFR67_18895 [Pilimelia sp.]|nr:hypothetical protein [Pilimelia sp.]